MARTPILPKQPITRRRLVSAFCALPFVAYSAGVHSAGEPLDLAQLRAGYRERLKRILATGLLPYVDIESSCNSRQVDLDVTAQAMDTLGIGLMALSADIGEGQFMKGVRFDNLSQRLLSQYPDRFIPVGNGGQPPTFTQAPDEFLAAQEAQAKNMLLLGEYEFRHYPSPRQVKRGDIDRDVRIPIDGPTGHRLFSLSEKTGLPFQIHYEIEDELLAPLEKMLAQYPTAKVVWAHVAQIRYIERASRYTPAYAEGLIKRFPNLYFDTAFGDPRSVYPLSNQRHARIWADDGSLKTEWRDLLVAHPKHFLSALDLGGDRLNRIVEYDQKHRSFLKRLPVETQHQVAYGSAWSLLFNEEFA
jgi:predicted TIM-barrel fold metal-dependent hydrolase